MTNLKQRIIDQNFFRPGWYSIFLNPYFINRRHLYSAIKNFARTVSPSAKILDIGCGNKPYKVLFPTQEYTGIDIKGGGHADYDKKPDVYYDGTSIPFDDSSFTTIICTQVLEHADNTEALIKESSRVLQSNGTAFFSMPFIYPEHEVPYDFRRFTQFQHRRLFKLYGFTNISIMKTTGFFGTFGQMFIIFIFESIPFRSSVFKTILSVFIFAPVQATALFLDVVFRKSGPTMDYIIVARKA